MSKRFLARVMAGTLTVALLLTGLCGCGKDPDTPAPTDATTTVSDTTTTAPDETTAPPTDATTTPDASATDAPTTAPTSKPTPALQTGGSSFTIDGLTFTMDTSPQKLLEHLGKPDKVTEAVEPLLTGIQKDYYYSHMVVETFSMEKVTDEILTAVYFTDDHYSVDGVTVGDTVKTLEERIGSQVTLEHGGSPSGVYAGPGYQYRNAANHMEWSFFFESTEEFLNIYQAKDGQPPVAPPNTPIRYMVIRYEFEVKYEPVARAAGLIDY